MSFCCFLDDFDETGWLFCYVNSERKFVADVPKLIIVCKWGLRMLLEAANVILRAMLLQMKSKMRSINLLGGECVFMNLWRPL